MIRNFDELTEKAVSGNKKRLAVAAAADEEVLKAVKMSVEKGLIEAVLTGDREKIINKSRKIDFDISSSEIIDVINKKEACIKAVKLVTEGKCDILMKGMVDTSTIMKEVLNDDYGLTADKLISHIAMVESTALERIVFVTDGGMNIKPDLDQKKQILDNAINVARGLGYKKPKIAALAAVEKINPAMEETLDAAALAKMSDRGQIKNAIVDGPLALDNALSKEAAEIKGIESPVAGKADILLVPEIIAGNILGKSSVYFAEDDIATIIGGTSKPIVLTSRANTARIKSISIAAAVLMASD